MIPLPLLSWNDCAASTCDLVLFILKQFLWQATLANSDKVTGKEGMDHSLWNIKIPRIVLLLGTSSFSVVERLESFSGRSQWVISPKSTVKSLKFYIFASFQTETLCRKRLGMRSWWPWSLWMCKQLRMLLWLLEVRHETHLPGPQWTPQWTPQSPPQWSPLIWTTRSWNTTRLSKTGVTWDNRK